MKVDYFLDTNILVYAATARIDDPGKFKVASRLVLDGNFGLSGQVLAEFYVISLTKPRIPPSAEELDRWLDLLASFPVAPVDDILVRQGVVHSRRYQISYWDGAVIAAAERLGASTLYTEDLSHDQLYAGVRVINPFRVG